MSFSYAPSAIDKAEIIGCFVDCKHEKNQLYKLNAINYLSPAWLCMPFLLLANLGRALTRSVQTRKLWRRFTLRLRTSLRRRFPPMMNRNSILLRRRNKVIVPRGDGSLPPSYTATINKNLESLGYTLSKNVLEALATLSLDDAARFYEEMVAILKETRGMRDYKPMYPNFPRQVMEGATIRFFLWWKEGEVNGKHTDRVDIDVSAVLYDAGWRYMEHISYTNLRSAKYRACHIGDITSAPIGSVLRVTVKSQSDQPLRGFGEVLADRTEGEGSPFGAH